MNSVLSSVNNFFERNAPKNENLLPRTSENFFEYDYVEDLDHNLFRSASIGVFTAATATVIGGSNPGLRGFVWAGIIGGFTASITSVLSTAADALFKRAAREANETPENKRLKAEDILFWANETRMAKDNTAPSIDVRDLSVAQQEDLVEKHMTPHEIEHYKKFVADANSNKQPKTPYAKIIVGVGLASLSDSIVPMLSAAAVALDTSFDVPVFVSTPASLVMAALAVGAVGTGLNSGYQTYEKMKKRVVDEERSDYNEMKISSFSQRYANWSVSKEQQDALEHNPLQNASVFDPPVATTPTPDPLENVDVDIDVRIKSFAQLHKKWNDHVVKSPDVLPNTAPSL